LQSILYGRPPFLDLAHSDCRFPRDLDPHPLPSGKSELGCEQFLFGVDYFLVSDFFLPISPLMEGSLLRSLPLSSSTAHIFRAPDELFIPSRTRRADPVIPVTFLSAFSYAWGTGLGRHPFPCLAAIFRGKPARIK
jgi:hypothetical protein